jgi:hypothetical protein
MAASHVWATKNADLLCRSLHEVLEEFAEFS